MHYNLKTISLAGLLCTATTIAALAQESSTPSDSRLADLAKCGAIENDQSRLQCYDTAMASLNYQEIQTSLAEAKTLKLQAAQLELENQAIKEAARRREVADAQEARERQQREAKRLEAEKKRQLDAFTRNKSATGPNELEQVIEITAKIVKVQALPIKGALIYLDNDQVWRQTTGKVDFRVRAGRTVNITKGKVGNLKMKVEGVTRFLRVIRHK